MGAISCSFIEIFLRFGAKSVDASRVQNRSFTSREKYLTSFFDKQNRSSQRKQGLRLA